MARNYRTDYQLAAILFETGEWEMTGERGELIDIAPSLHTAIQRARADPANSPLGKIIKRSGDQIVVMPTQVERLVELLASLETPS